MNYTDLLPLTDYKDDTEADLLHRLNRFSRTRQLGSGRTSGHVWAVGSSNPGGKVAGPMSSHIGRDPTIAGTVLGCMVVASLTGCGSTAGGDADSPGKVKTVALDYAKALYSGDTDAARQYVEEDSRDVFARVTSSGIQPSTVASEDLAVGSAEVDGDLATAVLIGTICSTGSSQPLPTDPGHRTQYCSSNTDPDTTDASFRIRLHRNTDNAWRVTLRHTGKSEETGHPIIP